MREMLFRGKRLDNGEWVEGYLCKTVKHLEISHQNVVVDCIEVYDGESYLDIVFHNVATNSIGQYTGLTDKNGKKIFEGDILAGDSFVGGRYLCGYVEYGDFNCSCCDGVYGWYLTDGDIRLLQDPVALTVVGNKWDNVELLEVDE